MLGQRRRRSANIKTTLDSQLITNTRLWTNVLLVSWANVMGWWLVVQSLVMIMS